MPQLVVELFEVVDVQQTNGQLPAVALHAGLFVFERTHQAAAVRNLRQGVGRHLVRQAPNFVLKALDPVGELAGTLMLRLDTGLRLLYQPLHGAAFFHHLSHDPCQAFQGVCLADGVGIAAEVLLKAVGGGAEGCHFLQHLVNELRQGLTG